MLIKTLGLARITLRIVWGTATLVLLVFIGLPHVMPHLDRTLYVVQSNSTQPASQIGSALIISDVDSAAVKIGQTIAFKTSDGSVGVRQVAGILDGPESSYEIGADDTGTQIIRAGSVIGRVDVAIPFMGSVLTMLSSTFGAVSALAVLGGLLLSIWFIEELLVALRSSRTRTATVAGSA